MSTSESTSESTITDTGTGSNGSNGSNVGDDLNTSMMIDMNYYGMSFDDYGANEFLNVGMEKEEERDGRKSKSNSNSCNSSSSKTNTNVNTNTNTNSSKKNNNEKKLVIMFVSTTGDAEHCDCIQDTWKLLLQKSIPSDQFANVTFALFSLGDRAYGPTAFCAAGRKLATRLTQLGATPFCNIGYGDDGTPNGGVFYDLDQWIEKDFIPCILENSDGNSTGNKVGSRKRRIPKNIIMNMSRKPQSPYQVLTSSTTKMKHNKNSLHLDNQSSDMKEEWQMQQYHASYNNFFASLCPATAYHYNPKSGHRIVKDNSHKDCGGKSQDDQDDSANDKRPLIGHVTLNERLTSKEWKQETRHIQIQVETKSPLSSKSKNNNDDTKVPINTQVALPYMAGDIATIIPSNDRSTVRKFLSCLPQSIQSKADIPLSIVTKIISSTYSKTSHTQWPEYATLKGILTYCADISSLPEREDLRSLSVYCNPQHPMGNDQRSKLISLSETTNAALFGDYVIREKRNWADVLFDFDSIQYEEENDNKDSMTFAPLNIEQLLMILSPIMPRHFSIASAPTASIVRGNESGYVKMVGGCTFDLDLCVAVVQGLSPHKRPYKGLCSNYLARQGVTTKQSKVRLWIRPGSFGKLPLDIEENSGVGMDTLLPSFTTPIMCIGAGTGIAPLRSLILEREAIRHQSKYSRNGISVEFKGAQSKDNILVFGCRKENEDYYYKDEWIEMSTKGVLNMLTAFSQDQNHKVYVQRVVREADDGLLIAKHMLENGGAVYVAGGAKMARAVKDEIIECLGKHLPNEKNDAKKLLQRLHRAGKFSIEAWS